MATAGMCVQVSVMVGLLLALGVYGTFEVTRFFAYASYCEREHAIYRNFSTANICTDHPMMQHFERLGLTNCSKAILHVENEQPLLCAVRNWYNTHWFEGARTSLTLNLEKMASSWPVAILIVCVIPLVLMAVVHTALGEREKTRRKALEMENQQKQFELMNQLHQNHALLSLNASARGGSSSNGFLLTSPSKHLNLRNGGGGDNDDDDDDEWGSIEDHYESPTPDTVTTTKRRRGVKK